MKHTITTLFLMLFVTTFSFAQDRQGNIVEYFGKEKVEDINEGEVIHIFREGLMYNTRSFPSEAKSVLSDPVFARILAEGKSDIAEGRIEGTDFSGEDIKWERIEVEENNEFDDRGLRSGYLYLEYDSDSEEVVLFEASGHTAALINGFPHEGDHYDFGWSLIPVQLKKGKNEFLLSGGRFAHMRARLLKADKPVRFTPRDLTLPDVQREEKEPLVAAIRVMNVQNDWLRGAKILAVAGNVQAETAVPAISPLNIRKIPFTIPVPATLPGEETLQMILKLQDRAGKIVDIDTIELSIKSKFNHHKKTFISDIDGSVQYYSVAPSLDKETENQALFLSVHGASVEAVNQANAYKQKDWGHVVAPTNRRPFGFAWEDWGRLDAMEVLEHSEELLKTDPQHTYLTGHSMGGHGTWYLGATYPDRFAAIAPAAGYPDLLDYRQSFMRRLSEDDFQERFKMTKAEFHESAREKFSSAEEEKLDEIIRRAGNPSRTLKLENNYLHYGVYILHGDSDNVVPTFLAQEMRERLGKFHNDFAYYEYPGGEHWFGDESVDWPPIFYFFNRRKIKADEEMNKIDFTTASPGVSAGSHFIKILQQKDPFEISNFDFERTEKGFDLKTTNVSTLAIDLKAMQQAELAEVYLDDQPISIPQKDTAYLAKIAGKWQISQKPAASEKGPHRNGSFKDAFKNNVVFVFATRGSKEENEWYYNRAKFDAEKFYYRANGNIEIIKDTDFRAQDYPDRNVVLYGNSSNNAAWKRLLPNAPVQVSQNRIQIGERTLTGDQWGAYFIYPRIDSDIASIGVVTATGEKGMKGAYANDYLENGTFFPDLLVFDDSMMKEGISGVKVSGFFGNSWSVEDGDFLWID